MSIDLEPRVAQLELDISQSIQESRGLHSFFTNDLSRLQATNPSFRAVNHRRRLNSQLYTLRCDGQILDAKFTSSVRKIQADVTTFMDATREKLGSFHQEVIRLYVRQLFMPFPTELTPPISDPEDFQDGNDLTVNCPFRNNPLNGILKFLETKSGGHPHDEGLVCVSASGCWDDKRFHPKNAALVEANNVFLSLNKPNQWICYDFNDQKVQLSYYAIRSRFDGFEGSNNPKDWVIEGSLDGNEWIEIDSKVDNEELNRKDVVKAWEVQSEEWFKCIRLRLTGETHSGKHCCAISAFELFGKIHKDDR
jgi:hypothetical protein